MLRRMSTKYIAAILIAVLTLTTLVLPAVAAAWYWISVSPGSTYVPAYAPNVWWDLYFGYRTGCPDTDMKWAVIYGDGDSYQSPAWYNACSLVVHFHDYPPTSSGYTWNPAWYVGQSGTLTYYMFATSVHTY